MTELRMGPCKRWTVKYLLRELDKRLLDPPGRTDVSSFGKLVHNEVVDWAHGAELRWQYPSLDLEGLRLMRLVVRDALAEGCVDFSTLAAAVEMRVLDLQLREVTFAALVARGEFNLAAHARLRLKAWMIAAGILIAAGWLRPAQRLCERVPAHLAQRHFADADPDTSQKLPHRLPFAWFALRLLNDWSGISLPARLPAHPYPSPAYEALLACWRDPDPAVLVEPLLGACDWHTHECMYSRSDQPHRDVDFIDDSLMAWPLEVHMVWRLRENLGLPLPGPLNHPLMQTAMAEYRPPWPQSQD